jgi:hypothetical protein
MAPDALRKTPLHRERRYRAGRAEHARQAAARRRREVPTWGDVAVTLTTSLGGAAWCAALVWLVRPGVAVAGSCLVLGVVLLMSGIRTLAALALRRHPVQVRSRARCSVCSRLFMPGGPIARHVRREESAGHVPARWVLVRVR